MTTGKTDLPGDIKSKIFGIKKKKNLGIQEKRPGHPEGEKMRLASAHRVTYLRYSKKENRSQRDDLCVQRAQNYQHARTQEIQVPQPLPRKPTRVKCG